MQRASEIRKKLRSGETVDFEGAKLKMIPGKETGDLLKPGDMYFAERNAGPKLLTVDHVVDEEYAKAHNLDHYNWVTPVELAYSYDFVECVGVEIVFEES